MKKILVISILLVVTISLVGCSWNQPQQTQEPQQSENPPVKEEEPLVDISPKITYLEARKYLDNMEGNPSTPSVEEGPHTELLVFGYDEAGKLSYYSRSEVYSSKENAEKAYEKLANKENTLQIDLQIIYNETATDSMKAKTVEQMKEDLAKKGYIFDI